MKIERLNKHLESVHKELTQLEFKELQVMQRTEAQASHCKPLAGDITLCAILCDGMSCGSFEHGGGGPMCMGLIKCRGFTGDGSGCKAFKIVQAKEIGF